MSTTTDCGRPKKGGGRCAHPVTPGTPCAAGHAPRAGVAADPTGPAGASVAAVDPFATPDVDQTAGTAELRRWHDRGFRGGDAERWAATGATPHQADEYKAAGFGPAETAAWMRVPDGLPTFPPTGPMARKWADASIYDGPVDPADAHAWRAAGFEDTADAARAFQRALTLGYGDGDNTGWAVEDGPYPPEVQAGAWASAGFGPAEQHRWHAAGFTLDDGRGPSVARTWADHVPDAARAGAWRRLVGNNPGAAATLERLGVTPDSYVDGDERFAGAPDHTGIFNARQFWRDIGITDGRQAQRWFFAGFDPWTAGEWTSSDPTMAPDAAADWRQHGFSATDTAAWRAATPAINPLDAARMADAGWDPTAAAQELAARPSGR